MTTESATPTRYQCRHIHTAGYRCGSPALRDQPFCYYHHTARPPRPHPGRTHAPELDPTLATLTLPLLEDRPSIQLALALVLDRLAHNTLDPKRARLLLYGLRIASQNLPKEPSATRTNHSPSITSTTHTSTRHTLQPLTHPAPFAPANPIEELAPPPTRSTQNPHQVATQDSIQDPTRHPTEAAIQDSTEDPSFGPLAPIAELPHPTQNLDTEPSWADQVLAELRKPAPTPPPTPCPHCQKLPSPNPETPQDPKTPEDPTPTILPNIQASAATPRTLTTAQNRMPRMWYGNPLHAAVNSANSKRRLTPLIWSHRSRRGVRGSKGAWNHRSSTEQQAS